MMDISRFLQGSVLGLVILRAIYGTRFMGKVGFLLDLRRNWCRRIANVQLLHGSLEDCCLHLQTSTGYLGQ